MRIVATLVIGVVIALFPLSAEIQIGSPNNAAILPQPVASGHNPAFDYLPSVRGLELGRRLPVGLFGFTRPQRNPLLYWNEPDTFRREFDFLSFYDQLSSPYEYLLQPSRSPEELKFIIEQNRLRLESSGGDELSFSTLPGSSGISLPRSPLIPLPLISYRIASGPWRSRTGLFMASSGYRVSPNETLQALLDGEAMQPSTAYRIDGQVGLDSGLSSSLSYLFEVPAAEPQYTLYLAPRLVGYTRTAYAELDYRLEARTDQSGLPNDVETGSRMMLMYPGSGWGGGLRFDLGTAVAAYPWRFGLSLLNLYGVDIVEGVVYEMDNLGSSAAGEPQRIITAGSDPLLYASAAYIIPLEDAKLAVGVNAGVHSEHHMANAVLRLRLRKWTVEVTGGRQGVWQFSSSLSRRIAGVRAGISWSLHSSPLTESQSWGIGLRLSTAGGSP